MSLDFFSTSSRKRSRDEDDDEDKKAHEAKRPTQSLPFRISPAIHHTRLFSQSKRSRPKPLFTQTLTPADSEEEVSPPFSTLKTASTQVSPESLVASATDALDVDMDMLDTMMLSPKREIHEDMAMLSPNASPRTLVPQHADAMGLQDLANTGRLPTPIYGHFHQPMQQPQMDMLPEAARDITPARSDRDMEYEQYLRSRRLPSPISEDEAMDFPTAPENSPLETCAPVETSPLETLPRGLRTPARLVQPLTGQSPPKGKIVFAMGFRADCEMCKNRVPGHSNHIFRV